MLNFSGLTSSSVALVVANLVPLFGVFWLGWDAFSLLLLFWLENVVIGIFNVLRMAVARGGRQVDPARKFSFILFFIFHYGGFTLAHGMILFSIFGKSAGLATADIGNLPAQAWQQVRLLHLGWSLMALFASHGVSFATNTLAGGEYRQATVNKLMGRPYGRVVAMHLTVLFGAILAQITGNSRWALVVLVGVKLAVDLRGHLAERRAWSSPHHPTRLESGTQAG